MKNKLSKLALATLLSTASLVASSLEDDTYSLIGVEGGYSNININKSGVSGSTTNLPSAGFKLGAQNENYRVFASVRYFTGADFDYITTYGAELQYLVNFSQSANFYFGANVGVANIKYTPSGDKYRTLSDSYFGGDVGFNFHLAENSDLELGVRYMDLNAKNSINNIEYRFSGMMHGYVSYIYKLRT